MNYKLKQTGQEVQDILDNAALQHQIHTIESFVPTTKLANGVYCTEANTIVVVQDNGNKVALLNPVNGAMYYQWQDDEYVINCLGVIATDDVLADEIHENGIFYSKRGKSLWIFANGGEATPSIGVSINPNSGISFCVWNDQEGYYDSFGSLGEIIVNTHASKVTLSMQVSAVDKFDFDIAAATQNAAGVMSAADKNKLDGIEDGAQVNNIKSVESIDDFFALDPYTLESGVWVCQGDYSLICVSELQGQGMPWMRFASFFDIDNCVVKTAMATGGSSSMEWSKTDGTYWRTVKNYENVIETIKVNGTTLQVSNKAVDIVLTTATSTDMVNLWNNL